MKRTWTFLGLCIAFLIGLTAGQYFGQAQPWTSLPDGGYDGGNFLQNAFGGVQEQPSPMDRIPERSIAVFKDKVILDIQDAEWATFTDTHSMEPVISAGANAIELVPENEVDVQVGDICSYQSEYADGSIIHRIVLRGQDEQGTYYIFKGDNLPTSDPGRVRFSQIQRCVVAIVY